MRGGLILVGAMVLAFGGVQLYHALVSEPQDSDTPAPLALVSGDAGCDPSTTPCVASGDGVRLALQFMGEVRGLTPVRVQVVASGAEVRDVELSFSMTGMDMGQNRYRLLPEGNGWSGVITLPFCTSGRSDWLATVRLQGGGRAWVAEFPFVMQAP